MIIEPAYRVQIQRSDDAGLVWYDVGVPFIGVPVSPEPPPVIPPIIPDLGTPGYRPHFKGAGTETKAGRGGAILRVTNLNDSGGGSLRAAMEAAGPRIVIFETSGTIPLARPILVTSPFLTVAGQSAPNPGITVRNHAIYLDTNDVVLQHLRCRLGDTYCVNNCAAGGSDVVYIRNNAWNIVLDHLSVSWGTHGGIDVNAWTGPQPTKIAILDCICSENLTKKLTPFATGTILMPSAGGIATFARNLHAHNGNRNPWVSPGWKFTGYNNVSYNAAAVVGDQGTLGHFQIMGGYGYGGPFEVVWVGNVSIAGPNAHADGKAIKIDMAAGELGTLYLADNTGPGQTPGLPWTGITYGLGGPTPSNEGRVRAATAPASFALHTPMTNASVLASVLAGAGARPKDRDAVDTRVVAEVKAKTGRIIESQRDVGDFPVLAVNIRPAAVPASPHAVIDAVGRTAVEQWLETQARALEP